jgi:hypothetical protein
VAFSDTDRTGALITEGRPRLLCFPMELQAKERAEEAEGEIRKG